MKKVKIKGSFSALSYTALLNKALVILLAMTNNKFFPTPVPTLADLKAAIDAYSAALSAAEHGSRAQRIDKKLKRQALETLLYDLSIYITATAKGDAAMLATCGFDQYKERSKTAAITAPQDIQVILRNHAGEIEIKISSVKKVKNYSYEYTLDPLSETSVWISEIDSRSRHLFKGLQSGKKYWFRVAANGVRGMKEYSIMVSCIVQ